MDVESLRSVLSRWSLRYANEADLQLAIAEALGGSGIAFEREVRSPVGRYDFLCGDVAIEVKVKGSLTDLTRQVHRYLESPRLRGLLVVTTRSGHRDLPGEICGKPVRVLWVAA